MTSSKFVGIPAKVCFLKNLEIDGCYGDKLWVHPALFDRIPVFFLVLLLLLLETVATHYKKSWGWVDVQVSNANYKVL